eukprot:6201535-Pleurochrysis_carterae.AAC.1
MDATPTRSDPNRRIAIEMDIGPLSRSTTSGGDRSTDPFFAMNFQGSLDKGKSRLKVIFVHISARSSDWYNSSALGPSGTRILNSWVDY